jgi:hypothetical protein
MDIVYAGSGIKGKWRLPGTEEAEAVNGVITKEGEITYLSLSRPFKGKPEDVRELLGTIDGNQGEWKLNVVFKSLKVGSSIKFSVLYLVESLHPVVK